MNSEIERVARAIWIEYTLWNAPIEHPTWGELLAQGHQGAKRVNEFRRYAQAALAAMLAAGPNVQISEAIKAERERCAQLHESVNPASDEERLHKTPGAGAMGAVIEYRDLIRARV